MLLGQIRDLLQPDHLQELATIISTPSTTTIENLHTALNQTKTRNSILKAQLKHWEDQLTDLIDKRISLELQYKLQQQQQQQ
jgi:cell division protein FtsB